MSRLILSLTENSITTYVKKMSLADKIFLYFLTIKNLSLQLLGKVNFSIKFNVKNIIPLNIENEDFIGMKDRRDAENFDIFC